MPALDVPRPDNSESDIVCHKSVLDSCVPGSCANPKGLLGFNLTDELRPLSHAKEGNIPCLASECSATHAHSGERDMCRVGECVNIARITETGKISLYGHVDPTAKLAIISTAGEGEGDVREAKLIIGKFASMMP